MPNSSKEKKQKKSSSSQQKKVPKTRDDAHSRKSHKRKDNVKRHETCAKQQTRSVKDDFHSSHKVKKPVSRLSKTQEETQKKSINKDRQRANTSSISVRVHRESSSDRSKKPICGEDKNKIGRKTSERKRSKPSDTSNEDEGPKASKIPKSTADEIHSSDGSSKLKKPQISPTLQEVQENQKRRVERAEELSKTPYDNITVRTLGPTSPFSKDSPQQKSTEEVKNSSSSHYAKELSAKGNLFRDAEEKSASTTEVFTASAKDSTSGNISKLWKKVTSVCGDTSASHQTEQPSSTQKQILYQKFVPFKFKIPKKASAKTLSTGDNTNNAVTTNKDVEIKHESKPPESEVLKRKPELETVQACKCLDGSSTSSFGGQDVGSSSCVQLLPSVDSSNQQCQDQGQVVEELHLARSEKRLEVDVLQSYGELTCMDVDSPEEGPEHTPHNKVHRQDLILVLDTNILLSHLDYVKKIRSCGLGALGFPVVLIPWVVLQELDSLKKGRGQLDSVAHLATPAISYIYTTLKNRDPRLWGQSMQQAAAVRNGLNSENNDDRVLQCCLQYQKIYPECALVLCTNDKNLCSKALLSGVTALCKTDLEAEVKKPSYDISILQRNQAQVLPHYNHEVSSSLVLGTSHTPVQLHSQEKAGLPAVTLDKDNKLLSEEDGEQTNWELSRCLSELEECLQVVLSDVLEVEMKAAYEEIWLEIVCIKPPWTLQGVLKCFDKHWIAVFGHIVPRNLHKTVLNLIDFFSSGKTVNRYATLAALQEAKELVKAFWKRSKYVSQAIAKLECIFNELQPQHNVSVKEQPSDCDVVMKDDDDEDKTPISARVPHQEVWAMFENIWASVFQKSLEVFKVLGFDPHTMQTTTPMGGPAPPLQDALACLHNLSSMVSQLFEAISSFLSSAPGSEEFQTLLTIISSTTIVNENTRLTAKDLHDCFSQPDYREKLRVGGNQLRELKNALDRCVQATGGHITFSM